MLFVVVSVHDCRCDEPLLTAAGDGVCNCDRGLGWNGVVVALILCSLMSLLPMVEDDLFSFALLTRLVLTFFSVDDDGGDDDEDGEL